MRRYACLLLALLLSGCIAFYQDASRQTYSDILWNVGELIAQLDAEEAACQTDECRADVAARRERALELARGADGPEGDGPYGREIDPEVHDLMFGQIGALKSAWNLRADALLADLHEVRATTRSLLVLDRRLEDVGGIQDMLGPDHVDALIAQREGTAQTLIALVRNLHTGISNFVPAMSGTFSALDPRTKAYLKSDSQLDIEVALASVGGAAAAMLNLPIRTGLDASNQDEHTIRFQRENLAGTGPSWPGVLGYLDQIESSLTNVSTGLANAETAMAGRVSEAGNQYRELAATLRELEQMRSESEANCLAVQ